MNAWEESAISMWLGWEFLPSSHMSMATGRRESTCKVVGVMNCVAPLVITTWTSAPYLTNCEVRSAAL